MSCLCLYRTVLSCDVNGFRLLLLWMTVDCSFDWSGSQVRSGQLSVDGSRCRRRWLARVGSRCILVGQTTVAQQCSLLGRCRWPDHRSTSHRLKTFLPPLSVLYLDSGAQLKRAWIKVVKNMSRPRNKCSVYQILCAQRGRLQLPAFYPACTRIPL